MGDIRHKSELGYTGHGFTFYQWVKCIDCNNERWVGLKNGVIAHPRCNACCNRITAKSNPHLFHKGEHNGVEFQKGKHSSPQTEWKKNIGYTGDRSFIQDPSFAKKISETLKSKHLHPSHTFTTENIGGKNHWNWQGGITPINHRDRDKAEYIKWRLSVYERDNYTCQDCKKYGIYLHAHHLKGWIKYPKLRFDVDNGISLCRECHWARHRIKKEVMIVESSAS